MPPAYTRFRDELAGILDERFHTIEWLDCQIYNGAIRVMASANAVILYKIERYPTGALELQGMAAAGELAEIKDELIPQAEEMAKAMGCKTARIESRVGWGKLLPEYHQYQMTIIKEL